MDIDAYDLIYLITNAFGTYVLYKLMMVFFDGKEKSRKLEFISYGVYFISISAVYILINIPVIMLILNIVAFFLITLNYSTTLKNRIIAVVFVYTISMCIEIVVIKLLSGMKFDILKENEYSLSYSLIVLKLLMYIVSIYLNKLKNISRGEKVPFYFWLSLILMPSMSLYIILLLFQIILPTIYMIIGVTFLLIMNFSTFYLYDYICAANIQNAEKILVLQQIKYYEKQLQLMEASIKTTRSIKHDLNNHLNAVYSLVHSGENKDALYHISEIVNVWNTDKEFVNSGNPTIDSILNFKLQEAQQKNINVKVDVTIPQYLVIASYDMAIILGNLLDNSFNAVAKLKKNREVTLKIKYTKGRLLLYIDNFFDGNIKIKESSILTTHSDRENHGNGLESIKSVLQKYDGSMEIEYSNEIFSVSIIMYME